MSVKCSCRLDKFWQCIEKLIYIASSFHSCMYMLGLSAVQNRQNRALLQNSFHRHGVSKCVSPSTGNVAFVICHISHTLHPVAVQCRSIDWSIHSVPQTVTALLCDYLFPEQNHLISLIMPDFDFSYYTVGAMLEMN